MTTSSPVADLTGSDFRIRAFGDLVASIPAGTDRVLLGEDQMDPAFFDLSSGVAGDLVQKCVNYRIRVALVAPDLSRRSERFREFARESLRGRAFVVVPSREEALARLGATPAAPAGT